MAWHHRFWNVIRRRDPVEDIGEELQFHIDESIRANIAAGMSPAEARQDALRRFGNASAIRDRTRDADVLVFVDDLRQDVSFALRSLRKRPGFTCAALLTLGIGIGGTTAIYTVVRSVLQRPLPFADPDALYVISDTEMPTWLFRGMSDRGYLSFRDANHAFAVLATFSRAEATLTGAGDASRLIGAAVTADFFRAFGTSAALGRTLGPEDDGSGSERVVLISDNLWRARFASDLRILDQTLTLDGLSHRIVGILPPGFSYPADAAYWVPLRVTADPGVGYIRPVVGRLKPGVTREQAQADLETWYRNLPPDPTRADGVVPQVRPLHEAIVGDLRRPLLVFTGAVALVLLIVCANVANLLLMRALARRREIATRLTLGASRGRLVRQLLTESALLSLAGGSVGVSIAWLYAPSLLTLVPRGRLPQDLVIRPDGWVLAFAVTLTLFTGLIVGLAPVLQTARDTPFADSRANAASATRKTHRLRHGLVVAQIALTLVLLVSAGLLLESLTRLLNVPLGFEPDRILTMTVDLPQTRYPDVEQLTMFQDRLLKAISGLPDIESAAVVNWLPLGQERIGGDVYAQDRPDLAGSYSATKVAVSPDYFVTMRIPLLRGRAFTVADRRRGEGVVIVSDSVARRLWSGADPLGKRVSLRDNPKPDDWLTVVGVVADVRQEGFRDAPGHAVYQPYAQVTNRFWAAHMTFVVRTNADPAQAGPALRTALKRADPHEAPQSLVTLASAVDRSVAEAKFQARLLSAFSLVALLLAVVGIYGVVASSVLERHFEIGIRMALGADRAAVVGLVLWQTIRLAAAGALLGVCGAAAMSGLLQSLLFSVTPTDGPTFAVAVVVLLGAAFAAALIPARRASSIDPLIALKSE